MTSNDENLEKRIGDMANISAELLKFQHVFNPQHYYCRLRGLGMGKKIARRLSEQYERDIYKPIMFYFKKCQR